MAMTLTDRLIDDAMQISGALSTAADNLTLALEQEAAARKAAKEAKQTYEAQEAEFTFEAMLEVNGSNAEKRKAELEAKLVAARSIGPLAWGWAQVNATEAEHADAEMALEQMKVQFRAVTAAAELQAAMLRAIAPR